MVGSYTEVLSLFSSFRGGCMNSILTSQVDWRAVSMEPACRKDKPKLNTTPTRGDRTKQKSAQQELKQRQRAEVTY